MRTVITLVAGALIVAGSALANLIPSSIIGFSTQQNQTGGCCLAMYSDDGTQTTEWADDGETANAYLLLSLGQVYAPPLAISVSGVGTPNLFTAFDVFVFGPDALTAVDGTLANWWNTTNPDFISDLVTDGANLVMNVTYQADGSPWTINSTDPDSANVNLFPITIPSVEYVLYASIPATGSNAVCPQSLTVQNQDGTCFQGDAFFSDGTPTGGQEDAYTTEIVVTSLPEPATFGLFGAGILLLGFSRRFAR